MTLVTLMKFTDGEITGITSLFLGLKVLIKLTSRENLTCFYKVINF